MGGKPFTNGRDRDGCGIVHGPPVHTARDSRERHGAQAKIVSDVKAVAMTCREQLGTAIAVLPCSWTNGVNDDLHRHVARGCRDRRTGWKSVWVGRASEVFALGEDCWTARAMNRAVHSAATEERFIRGIHDCVGVLQRQIASDNFNLRHTRQASLVS